MTIISYVTLKDRRLQKLMGESYHSKPLLRLMLSQLEDLQALGAMDQGRPVEWKDLETERERKICMVHFWKGVEQAREWQKEGLL